MTDNCCPFCDLGDRVIRRHGSVVAFFSDPAVLPGHYLIVPTRHVSDWFGMTRQERLDTMTLMDQIMAERRQGDWNIGMNAGKNAGQTVFHAHTHLIERRAGDVPEAKYGILRGFPLYA